MVSFLIALVLGLAAGGGRRGGDAQRPAGRAIQLDAIAMLDAGDRQKRDVEGKLHRREAIEDPPRHWNS